MKQRFINSIASLRVRFLRSWTWYLSQTKKVRVILAVAFAIFVLFVFKNIIGETVVPVTNKDTLKHVKVSPLSSLSGDKEGLPLVGIVSSISEATIRSETSGRLVRVYKKLGDGVYAGGVIAEFDNSGERAALLQAEGAHEQAKAGREIASLNNGQSGSSLEDTKSQALNAITSAYTSMDDAVRGKTDGAYSDPKFQQVKLLITIPDAILGISLENKRRAIELLLKEREARNKTLSVGNDLVTELTAVEREVSTVKVYLDDLFTAYSKALPDGSFSQTSLEANKAAVQAARLGISGTLSSLVASRSSLSAGITANQVSGNVVDGKSSGSLASADAQVKQALGAYNAALSRLEKTIIRSPISGTLNSLTINTGDYVSAFTQVAVVSNNGTLEVVSFVTEDDAKRISVSAPVMINGNVSGSVIRIAPALDPTTKKIEVRMSIQDPKASLTNGQSVRVVIVNKKKNTQKLPTSLPITVPLSSLKLTPKGAVVFSVTASNTLEAIPVTEGVILGEYIQIISGLTGNEEIVVDARGLKDGAEVVVNGSN